MTSNFETTNRFLLIVALLLISSLELLIKIRLKYLVVRYALSYTSLNLNTVNIRLIKFVNYFNPVALALQAYSHLNKKHLRIFH